MRPRLPRSPALNLTLFPGVEVAITVEAVAVRDSKNPDGPHIEFPHPLAPAFRPGCVTIASMNVDRISVNHEVMGGVPCVAGTRIPVTMILGLLAEGATSEEIIADYPQLHPDDVRACLVYAARAVDERELPVRLSA